MAQTPAGSSLLFGALADSGKIKQRKNGSYRMVLEGVDEINWFTDRPQRAEGTWKPQKLFRKWDKYFASSEPNAQVTVETEGKRELFTFEMFKPKIESEKIMFNIKPFSNSGEDLITGLKGKDLDDISLFIDSSDTSISVEIPEFYKKVWNNPNVGPFPSAGDRLGVALYYGTWNAFKINMSASNLLPWSNSEGEPGFVVAN